MKPIALAERILAIAKTEADQQRSRCLLQIQERKTERSKNKQRAEDVKEELRKAGGTETEGSENWRRRFKTQAETDRQEANAAPIKTGAAVKDRGSHPIGPMRLPGGNGCGAGFKRKAAKTSCGQLLSGPVLGCRGSRENRLPAL